MHAATCLTFDCGFTQNCNTTCKMDPITNEFMLTYDLQLLLRIKAARDSGAWTQQQYDKAATYMRDRTFLVRRWLLGGGGDQRSGGRSAALGTGATRGRGSHTANRGASH
jgi:hypothetical protein